MRHLRAPWWMVVVGATFLAYFALLVYSQFWGPELVGMIPEYSGGRMIVREVFPDSPGERAGLRAGDHIVAAEGQVIHNASDWVAIGANLEVGRPYELEIARDGKRLQLTLILEQRSWRRGQPVDRITALLRRGAQLLMLLLALLIAFSRPRDSVARMGAWLLAAATALGPPPYGFAVIWRELPVPLDVLLWIPLISTSCLGPLLFTFFAIFPRRLFRARWVWVLVWTPLLVPLPGWVSHAYRARYQPGHATGVPDWVLAAWLLTLGAYIVAGLVALVVNYRRLQDVNERRRLRVLVSGSVVGWLAVLPFFLLSSPGAVSSSLRPFFLSLPYGFLATILFLAFPLSFAYAILRHRLFDIRLMVRQGLQYALARGLLLSLLPVLAAILLGDLLVHGEQPLVEILRARGWVYVVLGGLALVAHLQRQRWLQALDQRFFRERYDAQRLLREVVEEVRQAGSFEPLAPRVVARIEAALHPEFSALLVREPDETSYRTLAAAPAGQAPPPLPVDSKLMGLVRLLGKPLGVTLTESGWLKQQLPHEETDFLRQARIDLLIPVATSRNRTEALLALGPKRSEEPYSREDLDLLVAIATSLAILLEKPAAVPARVSNAFEECPRCGTCYDTGVGHCAEEGAPLNLVPLPRLLADRYRLQRRLGRGGMGTVYAATDTALERRVAVKVIREDLVGSADAAERFRREARAAAGFTHPNVVTVHDFGLATGTRAFLVMELLQGASLREELRRERRLGAPRTLEILRGVCAAVEAAHRRQLIHRDLKPENIFLARSEGAETPKVLDFGIAKFLPTAAQSTVDTGSGLLVGTLRYMAPEQLRGQPVDAAWDVWALAVVAYEMLTGAHPFVGATPAEWQSAVLRGRFTPVGTYLPAPPARCQEFLERAFAVGPKGRPNSARVFFSELERVLA